RCRRGPCPNRPNAASGRATRRAPGFATACSGQRRHQGGQGQGQGQEPRPAQFRGHRTASRYLFGQVLWSLRWSRLCLLECASVRPSVIPLCIALGSLVSAGAAAQEVRLKNGDVIYADRVEESGDRVRYEVGDNSYSIPKSSVERIIAGTRPSSIA